MQLYSAVGLYLVGFFSNHGRKTARGSDRCLDIGHVRRQAPKDHSSQYVYVDGAPGVHHVTRSPTERGCDGRLG